MASKRRPETILDWFGYPFGKENRALSDLGSAAVSDRENNISGIVQKTIAKHTMKNVVTQSDVHPARPRPARSPRPAARLTRVLAAIESPTGTMKVIDAI